MMFNYRLKNSPYHVGCCCWLPARRPRSLYPEDDGGGGSGWGRSRLGRSRKEESEESSKPGKVVSTGRLESSSTNLLCNKKTLFFFLCCLCICSLDVIRLRFVSKECLNNHQVIYQSKLFFETYFYLQKTTLPFFIKI